ncbi:hypothetical protein FR943_22390 [Mycobacterium sp. TNTM28]|uniref:Integral membrane protein n=1 Tax=[Mycobacterium] fortunisiensis TaxID=2600579 RepID=A0ABS6KSN0_9MYCO|nr:7TM-DISM domain-containing protein [[Mycobacterium] fortunisiensis]MBU9766577.1 hypothetical protein [[Mycobacterium] fortunisiensis]
MIGQVATPASDAASRWLGSPAEHPDAPACHNRSDRALTASTRHSSLRIFFAAHAALSVERNGTSVWVWYDTAPWWVRWLITSAFAILGLLFFCWAVLEPGHHWWTLWPTWMVGAALSIFGLLIAAPMTLLAQPVVNSFSATLAGLTSAQRTAVARALRREPVPTDPAVLAAAVRAGDLSDAYRRLVSPTRRRLTWLLIALFGVVLPALEFTLDQPRIAVMYLGVGVLLAATAVRSEWARRRSGPRLVRLRAAAAAEPQVAQVVAQAVPPGQPTARQRWLGIGLIFVVTTAAATACVFVAAVTNQDCRIVRDVGLHVSAHRDLLNPRLIGTDGPDLSEYRAWSDELRRHADRARVPGVNRSLQQIADLSTEVVVSVEQARAASDDDKGSRTMHYLDVVQRLIDAENQLIAACTRS